MFDGRWNYQSAAVLINRFDRAATVSPIHHLNPVFFFFLFIPPSLHSLSLCSSGDSCAGVWPLWNQNKSYLFSLSLSLSVWMWAELLWECVSGVTRKLADMLAQVSDVCPLCVPKATKPVRDAVTCHEFCEQGRCPLSGLKPSISLKHVHTHRGSADGCGWSWWTVQRFIQHNPADFRAFLN